MNRKGIIIGVIVVVMVTVGGVVLVSRHTNTPAPKTASTNMTSNSTSPSTSSGAMKFAVAANDAGADQETLTVPAGKVVDLTFNVDKTGVYHGGLQFVSTDPSIDSGPINPGSSKMVEFTATKSFSFTPYWYASKVKKDYQITVNVQ